MELTSLRYSRNFFRADAENMAASRLEGLFRRSPAYLQFRKNRPAEVKLYLKPVLGEVHEVHAHLGPGHPVDRSTSLRLLGSFRQPWSHQR